jgi:hypothetical protein
MRLIGTRAALIAVAVAGLALPLAFGGSADAKQASCKSSWIIGKYWGEKQKWTLWKAIGNWEWKAKNKYGHYWDDWSYASHKSTWCVGQPGAWICWAKAKPCYHGGGNSDDVM